MSLRIPRRHVLRGIGGISIGLPLLEAMGMRRTARADSNMVPGAVGARPKRFIMVFVPNGTLEKEWYPTGTETDFTLGSIMNGPNPTDPTKSLAPHKKDLLILRGIDNKATQMGYSCTHNDIATLTTGFPLTGTDINNANVGGPSIDQLMAQFVDSKTPLKATCLCTGTYVGNNHTNRPNWMSQKGPNQGVPRTDNPADMFKNIFGTGGTTSSDVDKVWLRRKSILDGALADYQATLRKVSGADKQRLEIHMESIRSLETKLSTKVSCSPAVPKYGPYSPGTYGVLHGPSLPQVVHDFTEVIATAMSCDASRIATIETRPAGGGDSYFPWLGLSTVYADGEHHELTHDPDNPAKRPRLLAIYTWYVEVMASLIQKLKSIPDGDGTLFDTTSILQISENSNGATHSKNSIPFLLAGDMGKVFRTGRYVTYKNAFHNDLMLALLNGFGVAAKTFGDARLNTGPLVNLT